MSLLSNKQILSDDKVCMETAVVAGELKLGHW